MQNKKIRISKIISHSGICSRREAEILIRKGEVKINGKIFKEFSGCTGSSLNIIDKNELLKSLNSKVNSCKNVDFQILGLSLATINFLLSFIIFILILTIIKNEKNK